MNTVDVLRGAKEILSDEARWCRRGNYALDRRGNARATNDPAAYQFCGLGAVAHVAGLDARRDTDTAYDTPAARALLAAASTRFGFIHWNDHDATHEELIDAFDRALLLVAATEKAIAPEKVAA